MKIETILSMAITLIRISTGVLIFIFFFAIVIGPEIAHYINLLALLLTIIALGIFYKYREIVEFTKSIIIQIVLNLVIGLGLMIVNYGYFNR
jgi:hypothetical protein